MSTITEAKVPHPINTQIEVFSEDFWFLFELEKRKKISSSVFNDLALEDQGYLEKRFIPKKQKTNTCIGVARLHRWSWYWDRKVTEWIQSTYGEMPLLGYLPVGGSGSYEIRLSQKGKDWIKKYRNMEPEKVMSQAKDIFSWGAGLLRVAGGERWHGPYSDPEPLGNTSEDIVFDVGLASHCYRGQHGNFREAVTGLRRLGWIRPIPLDRERHHAILTKKGYRALKYVTDKIPVRMLTRILQERNSYEAGCQKNLRLVLPAIKQIRPKDWLPLFLGIAPVQRYSNWWHRESDLELAKVAQDLPNFRQAIAELTPEDWDFMLEKINPKIIDIIITKPELHLDVDTVLRTELFLRLEVEGIKTLIISQPSFLEAMESIPLYEWAALLTKANPSVRKLLAKIAKKTLARQAA
jgi:hypothetical protein